MAAARLREVGRLLVSAADAWVDDRAPRMGAALAYYTLFSIAPLLLIVLSVAGLVFGEQAARGELFGQLAGMVGEERARTIESLLESVSRPGQGVVGTVVGVLVLSAALSALGNWAAPHSGDEWLLTSVLNFALGFAFVVTLFAMLYKWLPRVTIGWRDVWLGAVVTALLFSVGKWGIGMYIGRSSVASGFGAAGSLVVLMLWVYFSAQILLFGAEITSVYARRHGSLRGRAQPERERHLPHRPDQEENP